MKLYVCYGTGGHQRHACGRAYDALQAAGYEPETQKVYGSGRLPAMFNQGKGRQEVKRLTGAYKVPVLQLDDGQDVSGSEAIADWAAAHPKRK
jgi:hypothetical protein